MTPLEAALRYAEWGWYVLPVVPNGKIPATQHGVNDATRDPEQIKKWWAQNPSFNIGVAAGQKSNLIVFDIDPRNGGDSSWAVWQETHGAAPEGAVQLTAGGGTHYLAYYSEGVRSCKLADGVDLLADGRYFVAYPSTIEGRSYQWEASADPAEGVGPFDIPPAWLAAYTTLRKPSRPTDSQGGGLIQGNRNNGLTALGGAMRHHGMTKAEIFAALSIANEERCDPPLPSSELAQIVASVSRYEPDIDTAAAVGIGSDAAEAILAAAQAARGEYFFTRATSLISQPAPLRWLVRGWLPDAGVSMIYGESGAGKTFVALDIACHIAAGLDWNGKKTRAGVVVFMAGEGNYGLRQRIAAWCKRHGIDRLDNLLVSNKAIDIDGPQSAAEILNAIHDVTDGPVEMLLIDTVNNHMAGDENSARDTRAMLNACGIVSNAIGSAVCLCHHTGHGIETKGRARGSSAWRASLDASLLVTSDDGQIKIACTKMKDAEPPQPLYGRLEAVPLGWVDEDGEEIRGAVFAPSDAPETRPQEARGIAQDIRKLVNAWFHSGVELRDGVPYVSRSGLLDYLTVHEGLSETTASQYVKNSARGKMIFNLLTAEIVTASAHGWTVIDEATAARMRLQSNNDSYK